jgi:hypothetical protein
VELIRCNVIHCAGAYHGIPSERIRGRRILWLIRVVIRLVTSGYGKAGWSWSRETRPLCRRRSRVMGHRICRSQKAAAVSHVCHVLSRDLFLPFGVTVAVEARKTQEDKNEHHCDNSQRCNGQRDDTHECLTRCPNWHRSNHHSCGTRCICVPHSGRPGKARRNYTHPFV